MLFHILLLFDLFSLLVLSAEFWERGQSGDKVERGGQGKWKGRGREVGLMEL